MILGPSFEQADLSSSYWTKNHFNKIIIYIIIDNI